VGWNGSGDDVCYGPSSEGDIRFFVNDLINDIQRISSGFFVPNK